MILISCRFKILTLSELNSEIVEFLLQNGAKVSEPSSDGSTPLYIAAQEGHNDVVMVHWSYQIFKTLFHLHLQMCYFGFHVKFLFSWRIYCSLVLVRSWCWYWMRFSRRIYTSLHCCSKWKTRCCKNFVTTWSQKRSAMLDFFYHLLLFQCSFDLLKLLLLLNRYLRLHSVVYCKSTRTGRSCERINTSWSQHRSSFQNGIHSTLCRSQVEWLIYIQQWKRQRMNWCSICYQGMDTPK